jgi:serine/threonine protein phosphatase 1
MAFNFFRKSTPIQQPILQGRRVYAVGDVHGRVDQLTALLKLIQDDCDTGARPSQIDVILLGDYIDRGRDSAAVLDLIEALHLPGMTVTVLRGNHEQVLIDLVYRPRQAQLEQWLSYGGLETLASYGLASQLLYSNDIDAILTAMEQALPKSHLDLLDRLPLTHRIGGYFFTHAGVRPGKPLDAQDERDLLWIREPFLSSKADLGAVVVHGHSISRTVENHPNRIGIDTGAYATGILTAVVLEEDQRRFLDTGLLK